jgi:uncharacterized protein (TIGR03067 family)
MRLNGLVFSVLALVAATAQADEKAPVSRDIEKLQGVWAVAKVESEGRDQGKGISRVSKITIADGQLAFDGGNRQKATFKLEAADKANRITLTHEDSDGTLTWHGIYALSGNELRLCVNADGTSDVKPVEFKKECSKLFVTVTLKRVR